MIWNSFLIVFTDNVESEHKNVVVNRNQYPKVVCSKKHKTQRLVADYPSWRNVYNLKLSFMCSRMIADMNGGPQTSYISQRFIIGQQYFIRSVGYSSNLIMIHVLGFVNGISQNWKKNSNLKLCKYYLLFYVAYTIPCRSVTFSDVYEKILDTIIIESRYYVFTSRPLSILFALD